MVDLVGEENRNPTTYIREQLGIARGKKNCPVTTQESKTI
jgi:hypothetical protein